nr:hypothetical protein [Haliscomenobacter sp.]
MDDVQATFEQLIAMGATEYEPVTVRGDGTKGFITASVVDPFGNILGIMRNPHYLENFEAKRIRLNPNNQVAILFIVEPKFLKQGLVV